MWRLVREGVRFYRHTLLISWSFGVGIFALVLVIIAVVGSVHDRNEFLKASVQLPLAILIASMVAGFIALGTEGSEHRLRFHLLLPVSLGQIAVARVLLPAALLLLGVAAAHVSFAALLALQASPVVWMRHLKLDFIAAQLLFWLQTPLVVRELIELGHRGRRQIAAGLTLLVLGLVALYAWIELGPIESVGLQAGMVAVLDAALMAFTVALFWRRTQFTR